MGHHSTAIMQFNRERNSMNDYLIEHSEVLTEAFINHACNPKHTKLFHLVGKRGWDEIQATETTAYQDAIVKELRAIA